MARAPYDTDPDILAKLSALYARMTPAEKLARVRDLTLVVHRLALEGLRTRYPEETEHELLLRLARRRLGPEVVGQVFPHAPEQDGP